MPYTPVPVALPPFAAVTHTREPLPAFGEQSLSPGGKRKRRLHVGAPAASYFNIEWDLSQEQMSILHLFYELTLLAGSLPFTCQVAAFGSPPLEDVDVIWVEPYTATPNEVERWLVKGKLLSLTAPALTSVASGAAQPIYPVFRPGRRQAPGPFSPPPPPPPPSCPIVFQDTFTGSGSINGHTPDTTMSGWVWQTANPNCVLAGGRYTSASGLVFADLYNPSDFTNNVTLSLPYKVTMVVRNDDSAEPDLATQFVLQDASLGADLAFFIEIFGTTARAGFRVGDGTPGTTWFTDVPGMNPAVAHTLEVLVEATRFTLTVDGVAQSPMTAPIQTTFGFAQGAVVNSNSYINSVTICNPT